MNGFKKILFYAKEHRSKFYTSLILLFLSVVAEISPFLVVYHMLKTFIEGTGWSLSYIIQMSAAIAVLLLLKTWFFAKGLLASHEVAFDTLMEMRKTFAKKMMLLPMGVIKEKGTGAYKKNFIDDIEHMEALIAHIIPEGVPYIINPILVIIVLFILDWRLALLSLGSIPFGLIAMAVMMKLGMKKMKNYYESEKRMNKTIVEYIAGMEVIKIFNRTTSSFEKYAKNVEDYRDFTLDWFRSSWTCMAIYAAVLPCTVLLLLPGGLHLYLKGAVDLSTFILSLMLAMSIGMPLVKLMEFMPNFPQLDYKISELEKTFAGEELNYTDKVIEPSNHNVAYKDVTFAYDKVDVLKKVSFEAKENEVTAIVGESGSGKSTLAKLLVHFWDVDSGGIEIGGVNICDMSMERLMDLVSYVAQDTFLFNIPIIENIRMGRPDATDEEVHEAAKLAQCHNFIINLENGYQTTPGDSGDKLSGGEKQRITIARAILKNAPIIILDEATSSTDSENEDLIQDAINNLIIGKTLIVIAHRLSTIVEADKIIVMEEGVLTSSGKHDELLESSDKYLQLWNAHIESTQWNIHVKEVKHA